jgi:L,D-transpeptidase ErfK/SrfK
VRELNLSQAFRVAVTQLRSAAVGLTLVLGACATFEPDVQPPPPPPPPAPTPPPVVAPVATHQFPFDPKTTGVLGELQVTQARHEDTLADIARRFNVGYDELRRANPGVDPWLPGEGTRIVLPTQWVLPDAPPEGIVVNVAAMRLFYFPKPAKNQKNQQRVVITYPIGVGKVGWETPIGTTKIVSKRKNPVWSPPPSVRKEHAEKGDPLPAQVPAGPDNPLGAYAMNLGWPSYLMHGTNKPPGVGMRASHGCIRLYPEDIESLFGMIPVGMQVTVVNQPLLYRWQGNSLYVQSYPPVVEGMDESVAPPAVVYNERVSNAIWQQSKVHAGSVNWDLVGRVVTQAQGIAVPVTKRGLTLDSYLASARRVENVLPEGSNWDGNDGPPAKGGVKPVADTGVRGRR